MNPRRPPIHLWIYNHPFTGITDQVEFFISALRQHGYPVSIGRQPKNSSLNVVIENFTAESGKILTDFCRSSRKRVAVIMTEHLDFEGGQIFVHGEPLWSDNDYMHPVTQIERIRYLMDCLPSLRCFLVLGDLPELRNLSTMLPGVAARTIPFPDLEIDPAGGEEVAGPIACDFLFTGALTKYRFNTLALLRKKGFSVSCPHMLVSRRSRDVLTRSARIVLNIPQRANWRWLSLMRVFAALKSGRATVSLGTKDGSRMAACCPQLDLRNGGWHGLLAEYSRDWLSHYRRSCEAYTAMAREFEREKGFPHDLFEYWAITDRLQSVLRTSGASLRTGASGS